MIIRAIFRFLGIGAVCLVSPLAFAPLSPAGAQSLTEALSATYEANPTLLASRAELRSVNERVPQELSNWRPSVTVSGTAGVQRIDNHIEGTDAETTEPVIGSLTVEQFLYRGGRTVAGTERAEAEVWAQRALVTSTEQDLLLQAVTAYMDVWRDQSVLQLNINNEEVLERQLQASRDRFEVGEITRTDVSQSESRLARVKAQRIESEGFLSTSRAIFQEIVGIAPQLLEQPDPKLRLPRSQKDAVGTARKANPDVQAAEFLEVAARKQVRAVFGELLPEVSLQGEVSHSEETSSSDGETDRGQLLARVTVPLYQQGFVSSRVREAKQVSSQRRLEIAEARRRAEQLGISAWENLVTARAQIDSFEEEVRATGIALEGVRQENAVGARTILDILDAEQEFLNAQVNLVRSQRDEVVASYELLRAVGDLTARGLGLPVRLYDPEVDYQEVRDRWFGISVPGE